MKRCKMNFFGIFLLFLGLLFINNCSTDKISEPKPKPDAGTDVKTDGEIPDIRPGGDQFPTIQLNFQDGDVLTKESVEIIASATDDKGISKVEIFIDEEKVATKTEAPYSYVWNVSQKFDGTYYLKAIAYDTADQIATDEARVIVRIPDRPAVAIINPTRNSNVCGLITIEAAVTVTPNRTVAVVEFFIDDKFLSNDKSGPTYTADWDTRNFSNEEHKIKAIITDSANAKAKDEIAAKVDNAAGRCDNLPSIVIEEPKTDTFINARDNDDITIKARASDDFGVIKVQFFIDNGMIGEDNSTPYSISWNLDDFDEGPHTLKAVAYDTSNQFTAMTIQVTLDRTPPSVRILSPSEGQHFGGADGEIVPIKIEAIDNFGIKEVTLQDNYDTIVILNAPPYEFSWDLKNVASGERSIRVETTDFAGMEADEEVSFLIDRPPSVVFIYPQNGDKIWGTIEIAVELKDDLTAADRLLYGFKIDDRDSLDWMERMRRENNVWKMQFDTTHLSFGEYTLQCIAKDGYGQNSSASLRVTVDQPLEVNITQPQEGAEIFEQITIKAEVKDDNPITKVELYFDDIFQGLMTGNPRQFVFNTITWPDGAHELRVIAYNDRDQTAEVKRNVIINNCDRDHDGHLSKKCGGEDDEEVIKIDILFVVDNSGSMEREQNNMAENVDGFINILDTYQSDYQIGVITTDMDTCENSLPCRCAGNNIRVGAGKLRSVPGCPKILKPPKDRQCPPGYPNCHALDAPANSEEFMKCLKNMLITGINGCGMEQGLIAARYATSRPLIDEEGENAGFIRSDAALAVIFVTDEEDCSHPQEITFESSRDCTLRANDLVKEQILINYFKNIKKTPFGEPDPSRVVLAGIIGGIFTKVKCDESGNLVPTNFETAFCAWNLTCSPPKRCDPSEETCNRAAECEQIIAEENVCYPIVLEGPPENIEGAIGGKRYYEVIASLNGMVDSICQPSFAETMAALGNFIVVYLQIKSM